MAKAALRGPSPGTPPPAAAPAAGCGSRALLSRVRGPALRGSGASSNFVISSAEPLQPGELLEVHAEILVLP